MTRNKKDCGLLPYLREDVYGLSPEVAQFYGWEIKAFDIQNQWKFSEGEGVKIAIIDTGCDLDHTDLKNNIIQGKNFIDFTKDPYDVVGHGTHTAGTIAAENNGIGMVGIAPKSKIMPVKALGDDGMGNIINIVSAIEWSVNNGADIISMSLGSPNKCKNLEEVIKYAAKKGVVIFCAAGNSGESADIMYPAKYDHTIAIGSIDKNLCRTSFTCSGETLDFLAPGHDILSCVPHNKYALMSGTSMSSPFAVGCAALLLSYSRQIKNSAMNMNLDTTEDYIEIFRKKAKNLSDPKYAGIKKYQGYGILYPAL